LDPKKAIVTAPLITSKIIPKSKSQLICINTD